MESKVKQSDPCGFPVLKYDYQSAGDLSIITFWKCSGCLQIT